MSEKVKRVEMVVTAESHWGIERGTNLALHAIAAGKVMGEDIIERHGVHVKWNVFDVSKPASIPGTIFAPPPPPAEPELAIPDLGTMDIDDVKAVIDLARTYADLDRILDVEVGGDRFPGGRKGVLRYIESRRKEIEAVIAKKLDEEA